MQGKWRDKRIKICEKWALEGGRCVARREARLGWAGLGGKEEGTARWVWRARAEVQDLRRMGGFGGEEGALCESGGTSRLGTGWDLGKGGKWHGQWSGACLVSWVFPECLYMLLHLMYDVQYMRPRYLMQLSRSTLGDE